jgi:prepilin-type N-terminal cleavage/methylation domain-containing protein
MSKKTGFTLVELLIAISLVGMIILSITAIDVASRRFINTANYAAQVQSEIGPILERMAKDISQAYGYTGTTLGIPNSGINITVPTQITIRQLDNYPHTYTDFTDDPGIRYTYNPNPAFNITRENRDCPTCSWSPIPPEVIARNIEAGNFTQEPSPDGRVKIVLTARRNAAFPAPADTLDNPRVILDTSVLPRNNPTN